MDQPVLGGAQSLVGSTRNSEIFIWIAIPCCYDRNDLLVNPYITTHSIPIVFPCDDTEWYPIQYHPSAVTNYQPKSTINIPWSTIRSPRENIPWYRIPYIMVSSTIIPGVIIIIWLVVWNRFPYIGNHHPNWPPTRISCFINPINCSYTYHISHGNIPYGGFLK